MSEITFLEYLTKDDILTTLATKGKKQAKVSFDQAISKFKKAIKDKTVSASKIRKSWSKAMNQMFFSVYQRVFTFDPVKKFDTSTKLKNEFQKKKGSIIKDLNILTINSYITKLSSSPLHYLFAMTFQPLNDYQEFISLPLKSQFFLSIFPEEGIAVFWPIDKDSKLKFATKLLQSTFENTSEIKVNALLLRKYSTQDTINKLVISTPQEIVGFTGLDVIEFRGPNVVLGLSGLKRRHDANVDVITRVGPFSEIESELISLVCTKGVLFKNYKGIDTILKAININ